jgi:MtN3 and saliva related transmembrane protein
MRGDGNLGALQVFGRSMDAASLVGYAATLCSVTSFVPQAWKVIRTRDTAAISVRMYAITVLGFALWLAYGILLGQWPLILTNAICLLLSGFILAMKVMPRHRRQAVAAALDPAP